MLAIISIALVLFLLVAVAIATVGAVVLWHMHRRNIADPFK